ncbi:MAG: outer membrane beta-barrel protein [bacterium]|nr:outer membrane beta-barrel protein [bacterium]
MRLLLITLLIMPLSSNCQETRTSLGFNLFGGYSGVRFLNNVNLDSAQQFDRGIEVVRLNGFFEYALSERRKAHITWGFGFDQSGYKSLVPLQDIQEIAYRQYYLYLPVSFKFKWTDHFYTSVGVAGGALIESRQISVTNSGKLRENHTFNYREFQLSSTLNLGYEIPLKKNRVFFLEAAGNYNWLGKITDEAAESHTQRSAWQAGLGIGIMKRF